MTVLITGASGLIGRHTVEQLVQRGHAVRTFQRGAPLGADVEHVRGDVRSDIAALCVAARGCAVVVHLAGRGDVGESRRDPVGYAELNATGAAACARRRAATPGAAFVLASTQRVYPLQPEPLHEDAPLERIVRTVTPNGSPSCGVGWPARSSQRQPPCCASFRCMDPAQQAHGGSGVVSIFGRAALDGAPLGRAIGRSARLYRRARRGAGDLARDRATGQLGAAYLQHRQRAGHHLSRAGRADRGDQWLALGDRRAHHRAAGGATWWRISHALGAILATSRVSVCARDSKGTWNGYGTALSEGASGPCASWQREFQAVRARPLGHKFRETKRKICPAKTARVWLSLEKRTHLWPPGRGVNTK